MTGGLSSRWDIVDWSLDRLGLTSGFVPDKVSEELDFLCLHLYPENGKLDEQLAMLKGFAAVGKRQTGRHRRDVSAEVFAGADDRVLGTLARARDWLDQFLLG